MVSKSDDMICWDAKYFILDVQIELLIDMSNC